MEMAFDLMVDFVSFMIDGHRTLVWNLLVYVHNYAGIRSVLLTVLAMVHV